MKYCSKIFDRLKPLAIESNSGWARLSSAIVYKNQIVSTGVNSLKSHPFQKRFGRNSESIFLHAEISAIKNALRHMTIDDIADADLYVTRVKRENGRDSDFVSAMARPCAGCQRAIAEFGIRNVFYTTDKGTVECL